MEPGSGHQVTDLEDDGGRALHARLLQNDPTAGGFLAERYLPPLVSWLLRAYPREDKAMLETVAIELILKVGREPEQYDPARLPLDAYLRMAARGDVKHAREAEQRRSRHHAPLENVELRDPARNSAWTDT